MVPLDAERTGGRPEPSRARAWAAAAALFLVLASAFIGRSVVTSDGGEMVSEALSLVITGELSMARIPSPGDPPQGGPAQYHSRYGVLPSLLTVPAVAVGWTFRKTLGPSGVEAVSALTWALGALAAAVAFLRLARALSPRASPFWAAGFLAGTFLWPYAADSFVEPWAGAALALASALLLEVRPAPSIARAAAVGALWVAACWLKPILWLTAPVLTLAALVTWRGQAGARRAAVVLCSAFAVGVFAVSVVNLARTGSLFDPGYGTDSTRFTTSVWEGLAGLVIGPGRSFLLLAPLALVAPFGFRRLGAGARLLCVGVPLLHLLVVARYHWWHGASAWGPRHLVPVLPLLVAPAVLVPRLPAFAIALGALLNAPGVLVVAGAFCDYAGTLRPPLGPPADSRWSGAGSERVSEIPALAPVYGHVWLLARGLGHPLPWTPWLAAGARESMPPPGLADCLSPWLLRRALGLPPIRPMIPRLLVRTAAGYAARGDLARAAPFARAAFELTPEDRDARYLRSLVAGVPPR